MSGLTDAVYRVLDRRLASQSKRPLALALSGGGDSVALTLIAGEWARLQGRQLLCLTVDHGLNPASQDWTATCSRLASKVGADFQSMSWTGEKPSTGLPAAARLARHTLLAEAARKAGASVILMGHTASDLAESAAMRAAGSTTPDAREWGPSPVWPEGRDVFLLRPMLGLSRSDLRTWLQGQAASWIEDPANVDLRYARSRARSHPGMEGAPGHLPHREIPHDLARQVQEDFGLVMDRQTLRDADPAAATALVGVACVSAGGGVKLPRSDRLTRLTQALRGAREVTMTLSGCQVIADETAIRWVRPSGDIARSGTPDLELSPGKTGVWDGRYEVTSSTPTRISNLGRHRSSHMALARIRLRDVPVQARGGLPCLQGSCVAPGPETVVRSLILQRFRAAAGLIDREPAA